MKVNLIGSALVIAALAPALVLNGQECSPRTKGQAQGKVSPNSKTQQLWRMLKQIIVDELGINTKEVTPNARIIEDLGADSLDMVELIMRVEEEFNIEIPDDVGCKFKHVCDIYTYLIKHPAKQPNRHPANRKHA